MTSDCMDDRTDSVSGRSGALGAESMEKDKAVGADKSDRVGPLREGDIYFWRWSDAQLENRLKYNNGSYSLVYWCKSQIAIVRDGLLIDTYWSDRSSERAIDPNHVVLTYQGNESELKKIPDYEIPYYEPTDVVDMRHSNGSREPVYVKPNAQRSKDRILEHLGALRNETESEISYRIRKLERLAVAIERVSKGDVDGYFP